MPDADDALNLLTMGVQTRDWRLLYIVYEVKHHTGQPSKMERLGWASAAEIKRFKATADSRRDPRAHRRVCRRRSDTSDLAGGP